MILGITLQEETGGTLSPPLPARFRAILPRDFKSSTVSRGNNLYGVRHCAISIFPMIVQIRKFSQN